MKLADFDYHLPEELIAQDPAKVRDTSRLMVLDRKKGSISHQIFRDITNYLEAGDTLVLNDTKVIPARLWGSKEGTGAKIEVLLLKNTDKDTWETLVRPGKKAKPGTKVIFGQGELQGEILDTTEVGGRIVRFIYEGIFEEVLDRLGEMPLPPYITKQLEDKNRYQTVYARQEGSAAAPTAGLHFTPELLDFLRIQGVKTAFVTLHVGLGTFRPVKEEEITHHHMHSEYYELPAETVEIIGQAKAQGKKVVAVGTTATRVLESVAAKWGELRAEQGWTDIFIYPGFQFKVIDGLLTNFHLPKSTLLMLISAFASREFILEAYQEAVENRYRFFSFGDAMLIL